MFWKKEIDGHEGAAIQKNWLTGDYRLIDKDRKIIPISNLIHPTLFSKRKKILERDCGISDLRPGLNDTYLVDSKIYIKGSKYENRCSILDDGGGLIFKCTEASEFMLNKDSIAINFEGNTMNVDANIIDFFKESTKPVEINRETFAVWDENGPCPDLGHIRTYTSEDILIETKSREEESVKSKSQEIQEILADNTSKINMRTYINSLNIQI
ncbi:MAG TPA: hypothetical protein DCP90_05920 [Clostridiales bacterium]|nr:MAG: hypothetical protein A2Y22_09380 [Clostridiales bacterium GWD2_32_59]HAN10130.1 hypothetical protein [Clostridiales bacterium]